MKTGRKILSLVLVLVMVAGVLPMTASARGVSLVDDDPWEEINPRIAYTFENGVLSIYDMANGTIEMGLGNYTDEGEKPAWWVHRSETKEIIVEDGITTISRDAFRAFTSLVSVTIPNSVTSIGADAFWMCYSLNSISIPSSVTAIETSAFGECTALTSIEIPTGVTAIQGRTFDGCYSLASVTIPSSVEEIGLGAFGDCTALTDIYYGGSEAEWNAIYKSEENVALKDATIHFNSPIYEGSNSSNQESDNSNPAASMSYEEYMGYWINLISEIGSESSPAAAATAKYADMNFTVNGSTVSLEVYEINGNNYFKLRDLALLVSGSPKQFNVVWREDRRSIELFPNRKYEPVGGELSKGDGVDKQGKINTSPLSLFLAHGEAMYGEYFGVKPTAYTINGNNYFKLRDLCKLFDIGVTWDEATWTVGIDTSIGYTE